MLVFTVSAGRSGIVVSGDRGRNKTSCFVSPALYPPRVMVISQVSQVNSQLAKYPSVLYVKPSNKVY